MSAVRKPWPRETFRPPLVVREIHGEDRAPVHEAVMADLRAHQRAYVRWADVVIRAAHTCTTEVDRVHWWIEFDGVLATAGMTAPGLPALGRFSAFLVEYLTTWTPAEYEANP